MAQDPTAPGTVPADADQGEEGAPGSGVGQKVELDLDDAPFLKDEEPEPETKKAEEPAGQAAAVAAPAKPPSFIQRLLANKKRLILAGAAFVVLAAAGIGVTMFMGGETPPPPTETPRVEQLPEGPPALPAAALPKHTLSFEPFWVEQKDTEGNIRFLSLAFAVPTDNDMLLAEMNGKKIVLRDALFYYLSRRPLTTLQDEATMESLKSDLVTVINELVANGKINDIFIESYLVK